MSPEKYSKNKKKTSWRYLLHNRLSKENNTIFIVNNNNNNNNNKAFNPNLSRTSRNNNKAFSPNLSQTNRSRLEMKSNRNLHEDFISIKKLYFTLVRHAYHNPLFFLLGTGGVKQHIRSYNWKYNNLRAIWYNLSLVKIIITARGEQFETISTRHNNFKVSSTDKTWYRLLVLSAKIATRLQLA